AHLFDIQNQGLSTTDWTTITHTVTGVTAGSTTINMQFQIAAGAFNGAGGGLLIDNIQVSQVPEPSTVAAIFGLCALGFVVVRRRRKP
ncbi:MAG: PEP-CTERM sorting domain-containing protein, partial [Coraliomargarita sp.]